MSKHKYAEQARVLRAVADNLDTAQSAAVGKGFAPTLREVADDLDPPKVITAEPTPEPEAPIAPEVVAPEVVAPTDPVEA
jgi:hypothetical protein